MPWITMKISSFWYGLPNSLVCDLMAERQSTSSPSFLLYEKDKTLAGLSLPRYFLFISRDFRGVTKATEREYFFPKMAFFISSYI